jgi:subtilisin family serine protease
MKIFIIVFIMIFTLIGSVEPNIRADNVTEYKLLFQSQEEGVIPLKELDDADDYVTGLYNPYIEIRLNYENEEKKYMKLLDKSSLGKSNYFKKVQDYFEKVNQESWKSIEKDYDFDEEDVFISKMTPYIYVNLTNYIDYYEIAQFISESENVARVILKEESRPLSILTLPLPGTAICLDRPCVLDELDDPGDNSPVYDNMPENPFYDGTGIQIGMVDRGEFDTNHEYFSDIHAEILLDDYNDTGASYENHSTIVASIMVGEIGIAPNADIYFIDAASRQNYISFELFFDDQDTSDPSDDIFVDVINMSYFENNCIFDDGYSDSFEAYIDWFVDIHNVPVVASTGNFLHIEDSNGYICQPASSSNVISVGAIDDEGNPWEHSSYKNKNGVANNPLISAVGENRQVGEFGSQTGTSFSSPAVAATAALLVQKHPYMLATNIATILTVTANNSKINTSPEDVYYWDVDANGDLYQTNIYETHYNYYDSGMGFNPRTGAGALDINAALEYDIFNGTVSLDSTWETILFEEQLTDGDEVIISIAWNRGAHETLFGNYRSEDNINVDIFLLRGFFSESRTTVVNSTHESIRYTVETSGLYTISLNCNDLPPHVINVSYSFKIS